MTNATWAAVHRRQAADLRQKGGKENADQATLLEAEAAFEERQGDPPRDPSWTEQDRGVQLFFCHACDSAIESEPVFFQDIEAKANQLRELAEGLRRQASISRSFKQEKKARQLEELAMDHEDEADILLPQANQSKFAPQADDPWVIRRDRGDAEIRTYVALLSTTTSMIFKDSLFGVLAIVANVVHERNDVTRAMVREWLRDPRDRKELAATKRSS
ncbi:hypothetical protein HAP48_0004465 [Bradyrhizobium septentrionale]|uniref:Uncharacterized protein n=1 Tax=Bradyrhizobium septentrionale TaxID=1404411 RepID=A0A973W6A7_9BRAD|nr:hypothetical protein [Bradyrhizobium septentrionale]UGY16796.1 hypothetical protein HAP48_0004465 [Bradyrhizobium septentrionale]